jgi:hypothetical protein
MRSQAASRGAWPSLVHRRGAARGELLGLRWKHVHLADPDVPHVEIAETPVAGQTGPPKSDAQDACLTAKGDALSLRQGIRLS